MANRREIQLPKPFLKGRLSLEEAIYTRRSKRSFRNEALSLEQIGQLLWSAQGVTAKTQGIGLRTAPSAGALYPIELYSLTREGVFHYLPEKHKLVLVLEKDLRNELANACHEQEQVSQVPLNIVICSVYSRVTGKYGQRGHRYVHIEAGHVGQNVLLEAVALGLGSVPVGAFDDEEVQKTLELPKDHEPLYIIPVGYVNE